MVDNFGWGTLHQHSAIMQNIGALDHIQSFANIMIGYQNTDAAVFQMVDEIADVMDRNWINSSERLVEEHESRLRRYSARDFNSPPFPA